jgi:hypothetical protein
MEGVACVGFAARSIACKVALTELTLRGLIAI